jgi:Fur family iron response transcriptional regulator
MSAQRIDADKMDPEKMDPEKMDPETMGAGNREANLEGAEGASIIDMLRARGISPTQQRVEIARILFARPQHLCAEQLLHEVNEGDGPAVSKATVYNTLKLFAREGFVREVIVDPAKVFYDSNTTDHHHLYDVSSGALTDIAADRVRLEALPDLPDGAVVEGVDVVVRIRRSRA